MNTLQFTYLVTNKHVIKWLRLSTDHSSHEPSARRVHCPPGGVRMAATRDARTTYTVTH